MNEPETNPFTPGSDRHELWEMLVRRDIDAFLTEDWEAVEPDFCRECFFAVDAGFHPDPDRWKPAFAELDRYRDSWLGQAREFAAESWRDDVRSALFAATDLSQIEVDGDAALLHKKFDGALTRHDGSVLRLFWQTLYQCRRIDGRWRIVGFTGYLPGDTKGDSGRSGKRVPEGATQHTTAGPYSPVLEIEPRRLVVISGQAAILPDGRVRGETIEEQSGLTLDNCESQLARAGCGFQDVFKVNVYLADLADWPRFNEVYARRFPEPRPVRTAVGARLLEGLMVEVELWAVRPG